MEHDGAELTVCSDEYGPPIKVSILPSFFFIYEILKPGETSAQSQS